MLCQFLSLWKQPTNYRIGSIKNAKIPAGRIGARLVRRLSNHFPSQDQPWPTMVDSSQRLISSNNYGMVAKLVDAKADLSDTHIRVLNLGTSVGCGMSARLRYSFTHEGSSPSHPKQFADWITSGGNLKNHLTFPIGFDRRKI